MCLDGRFTDFQNEIRRKITRTLISETLPEKKSRLLNIKRRVASSHKLTNPNTETGLPNDVLCITSRIFLSPNPIPLTAGRVKNELKVHLHLHHHHHRLSIQEPMRTMLATSC